MGTMYSMDTATRRGGVFYTPLPFAEKACNYLDKTLGTNWLLSDNYRLWDMAAGTGHLELFLPKESQKYCYLSTLEQEDVRHLEKEFPDAAVFQYDYLNDDVGLTDGRFGDAVTGSLLPSALQKDLANPQIKWVILVNPPYATAQEAGLKGRSKEGVSDTKIRKQMHAEELGEVSRELYVQFLYRIMSEFKHRKTLLGLFAPLKYLVSTNYQKFRDHIFHAAFQSGFIFSSEHFGGTSKTRHFPVSFILWDIDRRDDAAEMEAKLNILDHTAQKIGIKTLKSANRNEFLNRWIRRPRGTKIFPPFSSALTVKSGNADPRHRIAEGFLASLMCPGNELQNQQQTAFLSGPQVSAGALSVTPDNFEQAVVVFAARRIPKDTWITHVDQLMRPNRELSPQFISACAVWSLFDGKNQTVSLRDVQYLDRVYQIENHFFPFPVEEVRRWFAETQSFDYAMHGANNSFVADWLSRRTLSGEAQEVLESAKTIYRCFFANRNVLPMSEFGIATYDAGWYQIQKALHGAKLGIDLLADLKYRHNLLREKILPQLYDYGIL